MRSNRDLLSILQVSTSDRGGGAEGSALNLHKIYRARGHSSWIAVGDKQTDDPHVVVVPNDAQRNYWTRACLAAKTKIQDSSSSRRSKELLYKLAIRLGEPNRWLNYQRGYEDFEFPGTWKLLGLTPTCPDIVHCHNLHGQYFDLRALPWLSHQVPLILNLRDAWTLSGHCAYSLNCERWKTGCGSCPDLTIYPALRRDGTAYNWQRKADIYRNSHLYISTPSQWLMDQVRQSMLSGVECRVIPNAIDLDVFKPGDKKTARLELGLPLDSKVLLFVANRGSRNPFKDYAMMKEAVNSVASRSNENLLFVCLGAAENPDDFNQANVRFVPFEANPARVALYYQAADIYLHAAKAEVFGKAVTEALACGIPVVASSVGGIPEQIEEGTTGYLVPPGDAGHMAFAIEQLLANEELRERLSVAAATDARRRFGLNRQADDFLNWYYEIIENWQKKEKSLIA